MRDDGAVALQDLNVLDPGAELVGNHLRERGLEPLAVCGNPETAGHRPGRIKADRGGFCSGVDRHPRCRRNARPDAGQFRVGGDADANEPAFGPCLRLFLAQQVIPGCLARARQGVDKTGTVPDDAGGHPVRELVGSDQVPQTKLNGIDRETLRRHVDQPLHDERRDGRPTPR